MQFFTQLHAHMQTVYIHVHNVRPLYIILTLFSPSPPVHRLPPVLSPSHPPDLWTGFSRTLSLAMKPQNINPFLTEEERREEALVSASPAPSLASVMKYFVPERSYVSDT